MQIWMDRIWRNVEQLERPNIAYFLEVILPENLILILILSLYYGLWENKFFLNLDRNTAFSGRNHIICYSEYACGILSRFSYYSEKTFE